MSFEYATTTKVRKADGTKINSTKELMSEWRDYFKELLNVKSTDQPIANPTQPASKDLKINTDRISLNEVVEAIEQLKNGKSPGYDYSITPEALKYGGNFVKYRLDFVKYTTKSLKATMYQSGSQQI